MHVSFLYICSENPYPLSVESKKKNTIKNAYNFVFSVFHSLHLYHFLTE